MSSFVSVIVEWRRGVTGLDGTFIFNPKPNITRKEPGRRVAELIVPLLDGEIVQNLGLDKRTIELKGVLFTKSSNWDIIEVKRNELIDGIGVGPGQLHIISPGTHLRYDGQITTDGIKFAEQERSNLQDYTITILNADPVKIIVP